MLHLIDLKKWHKLHATFIIHLHTISELALESPFMITDFPIGISVRIQQAYPFTDWDIELQEQVTKYH